MAFSLEAAIVIPIVIVTWLGMSLMIEPAAKQVRLAACLEQAAAMRTLDCQHLYRADILRSGDVWTTGLQTSPQAVLEIFSLIRDDGRLISDSIGILTAQVSAGGES